jgi:hypothetical protein
MDPTPIIAGLDAILPEQERALQLAARNVKLGLERDSTIYRAFTQLQFFVLTVDFDMRVMLRALLVDPQNRLTAEKFLALTLQEADDTVGKVTNTLKAEMRKSDRATVPDSGAQFFDEAKLDVAVAEFKTAMAGFRDDVDFQRTLRMIRNTVSGHIVGDEVGVQNSAIWVLTREGVPRNTEGVMMSQIVSYAVSTGLALLNFARALQGCAKLG